MGERGFCQGVRGHGLGERGRRGDGRGLGWPSPSLEQRRFGCFPRQIWREWIPSLGMTIAAGKGFRLPAPSFGTTMEA